MRGSTTAIVGADGMRKKGYEYDAFGSIEENGSTSFLNETTFTGSISDKSTGLQYMNARFYNPATGRFLSQDTYSGDPYDPWTQHLYVYTTNNPVNFTDPTGHFSVLATVGVVALLVSTLLLGGCSKKEETPVFTAPTPALRPSTAKPSSTSKPSSTPKPSATPTPSPSPTPSATPKFYSNSKGSLTSEQTKSNATTIYNYLVNDGWSHNAACATLGNMQGENRDLNPARQENGGGSGYGLCQWTPQRDKAGNIITRKYLDWAPENSYTNDSLIGQLEYLKYSMSEGKTAEIHRQWYKGESEYGMLATDFISSNKNVDDLTKTFGACYERSAAMIAGNYDWSTRISYARNWDSYFSN